MNIAKTEDMVTVTMTQEEAEDMRNAYRFAQYYWAMISAQENSDDAKEVCNRIAISKKITGDAIADVIGY